MVKARNPLTTLWVLQKQQLLSNRTEMYLLCRDYMSKKNTHSVNSELLKKSLPSKVLRRQTVLKACASVIMSATEKHAIAYSGKATITDFKSLQSTKAEAATHVLSAGHPEHAQIPSNYFIPQWSLIFHHDDLCIEETETTISLLCNHNNSIFSLSTRN